jgi:TPP-dependent pyruvate/acetoin dehydrogenase alpha subunit
MIFLCEDNGFAVTTRASDTVSVEHISERAASYSIPGINVDGQDILAVFAAVSEAVERARTGQGPTLLDVKTYRYREHAEFGRVGDSVRKYRSPEEVERWRQRDPIELFAQALVDGGTLDADGVEALRAEVQQEVQEAAEFAQESPYPELEAAYEHLYVDAIPAWH